MVEHHREVASQQVPVKSVVDAWAIRRRQYERWLAEGGDGTLFVARERGRPVGYAMLTVSASGATWEVGGRQGELESLAVAAEARGAGVGTALIEVCRDELRRQGVETWVVAVVEANHDAVRLYEREGFEPFYRALLGRV
jgi:GNAT superfamily N-acetyltransferase